MEDTARLALLERSICNDEDFKHILFELLHHICLILNNPNDQALKTFQSNVIQKNPQKHAINDYLKYMGFQLIGNNYKYPRGMTLSNLRFAQMAIERKILFCYGAQSLDSLKPQMISSTNNIQKLTPEKVLKTSNTFLLKIESMLNNMLNYEDEELLERAREHIPVTKLQLLAMERMRKQQKNIKTGKSKDHDMPYNTALLMELIVWFKHKFFHWVDKPPCQRCEGNTTHTHNTQQIVENENCLVEVYECTSCRSYTRFPRHNRPGTLLETRRGRCGEWANCFTLLSRALGYDTRYVYDTTDHVWCEVFDMDTDAWVHVDPCEAAYNTPLIYCTGWNKQLSYVIALSRDDLQDVTWRYTVNHKDVLKRRKLCSEADLISAILELRSHRHRQVTEARRKYLTLRNLKELVQLTVERSPSEYENVGRISGAREWREQRGETMTSHTFSFAEPAAYQVQYCTAADTYKLFSNGLEQTTLTSWRTGVYESKGIFRKVEHDWNMTYLAREEDENEGEGFISWRFAAENELSIEFLQIAINFALYEKGRINWTIQFDNDEPIPVDFKGDGSSKEWRHKCRSFILSAKLSGYWQHSQLGRQPRTASEHTIHIHANVSR